MCAAASWATTSTDTAVAAMLADELETARHFVRRELGPLAAETSNAADLRATLLCYCDEEGSPFAAARRLHVSRNTVGYRVKCGCDLLGFDIATRRYLLHTAGQITPKRPTGRFGTEKHRTAGSLAPIDYQEAEGYMPLSLPRLGRSRSYERLAGHSATDAHRTAGTASFGERDTFPSSHPTTIDTVNGWY
jgi:hypothetical protein